jgi:SSS family solute:Na+ symporter
MAAALIAAIMSSLDSALNAAGTLVVRDFVLPWKPDIEEKRQVFLGRVTTGVAMVVGAVYAPMIANFESLFEYFQSSLSYIVPPIIAVFLMGLFVPRSNGLAAFWTIILGLVVGVPLFILKEVTGMWGEWGLPELHFTVMCAIMLVIGVVMMLVLSSFGESPDAEAVAKVDWRLEDVKNEFTTEEDQAWYNDYKLYAAILFAITVAIIVWFW